MIKNTIIACLVLISCSLANGAKESNECNGTEIIADKPFGEIRVKGNINASVTCIWNISVKYEKSGSLTTVFLKELYLDDDDSVVISLPNTNETLFGPFHGSMGSFVLFVEADMFIVTLTTSSRKMIRKFDGYFNYECHLAVDDIPIVAAPYYKVRESGMLMCKYVFSKPLDKSRSLVFDNFHLSAKSSLMVQGSDGLDSTYTSTPPDIFGKDPLTLTINIDLTNNQSDFTIYNRAILKDCIKYYLAEGDYVAILKSVPRFKLINDTTPHECRWLIKADKSPTLGMVFDKLEFSSVLDTLVLNDGPSELSSPIAVVAQANQNLTKGSVIRTSGPYLWVSFRSLDFSSNFSGNVSAHGQGGYHRGNGNITMNPTSGNDTIFLLEVDANENVFLSLTSSTFKSPASLMIYENFNSESNYLAQFHGDVWAPIVSRTSRMMLVASGFSTGTFTANFRGIKPGCMHTSPPSSDSYILSGNCNSSCIWMVSPQSTSGNVVLLQFQFLSLSDADELQIIRLDEKKSLVATIGSNITQVPQISLRADEGFYVNVTRGDCSKRENDIILIAHTTYRPACSKDYMLQPATQLQIASPSYPDTYPLLSECQWNITMSSESSLLHLTFNKLQLAPNHCINITQTILGQKMSTTQSFSGDQLPDDLLNGAAIVQFDSFNCHYPSVKLSLVSNEGFSLNVTSADCGGIMNKTTGEFYTEGYPNPSTKSNLCIWKVQVPAKDKEANYISFHVDTKDGSDNNHELRIFDGASVRDVEIKNTTDKEIWSRNYTVLFMYRRLNSSRPSAAINITYRTISCNSSFQCSNGICIHPDWRCNGVNDCGDNTDEIKCATVPIPEPDKKTTVEGIAPVAFGLSIVCFFILGVVATLGVPYLIQRYRNGRYHQFRDLSEGN